METVIVEKETINLQNGVKNGQFAVLCSKSNQQARCYSLTFEGYLTPWSDHDTAIIRQIEIENGIAKAEGV